jgi:phage gp29-like protein
MASIDDIVAQDGQLISTFSTSPIHASALSLPMSANPQFLTDLSIDLMQQGNYKIDANLLIKVFSAAKYGFSRDQCSLFKDVIEKAPIIRSHLQTRKLALLSVDWSILGGTNQAKRDAVRDILNEAGISKAMMHLSSAMEYGFSFCGIRWGAGLDTIREFTTIEPLNMEFRPGGSVIFAPVRSGERIPLDESNKHWFVFHSPNISLGIPSTIGLMRTLMWIWIYIQHATREKARYLEQYGIPFLTGTVSENDFRDDNRRNELLQQLYSIGSAGAGLCTNGMKIEALQIQGAGAGSNGDFVQWIQHNEDLAALLILGQVASSGPTGGFSKGQLQGKVLDTIVLGDTKFMSETITNQIIRPLEEAKYGTHELRFDMTPMDWEQLQNNVKTLKAAGFSPKRQWIEDKFGVPLEDDEKEKSSSKPAIDLSSSFPQMPAPEQAAPAQPAPEQSAPAMEAGAPLAAPIPMSDISKVIAFDDISEAPEQATEEVAPSFQEQHNQAIDSSNLPEDIKSELRAGPEDTPETVADKIRSVTYAKQAQSEDLNERDEYERVRNESLAQLNKSMAPAPTAAPEEKEEPLFPPPQVIPTPPEIKEEMAKTEPQSASEPESAQEPLSIEGRAPRKSADPLLATLKRGYQLSTSELPPSVDDLQIYGKELLTGAHNVMINPEYSWISLDDRKKLVNSMVSMGQTLTDQADQAASREDRSMLGDVWTSVKRGLVDMAPMALANLVSLGGRATEQAWKAPAKYLKETGIAPLQGIGSDLESISSVYGKVAQSAEDYAKDLRTWMETDPTMMQSKQEIENPISSNAVADMITEKVALPAATILSSLGKVGLATKAASLLGVAESSLPTVMKLGFMTDIGLASAASDFAQDFPRLKAEGKTTDEAYSLALSRAVLDGAIQSAIAFFPAEAYLAPALRRIMGGASAVVQKNIPPTFLHAGLSATTIGAASNIASAISSDLTKLITEDSDLLESMKGDEEAKQRLLTTLIDTAAMTWPAFFLGGFGRGQMSKDMSALSDVVRTSPDDVIKALDSFGVSDSKIQTLTKKASIAIENGDFNKADNYLAAVADIHRDIDENGVRRTQALVAQGAIVHAMDAKFGSILDETGVPAILSDSTLASALSEFAKNHGNFSEAMRSGDVDVRFVSPDEMKSLTNTDNKAQFILKNGRTTILIDGTKVASVNELHDLLGHEDFVHRFLYGHSSAIPEARRQDFENLVNDLANEKDNGFWNKEMEDKYREVSKSMGVSEEAFMSWLQEEKVGQFVESGAFRKYENKGKLGKYVHNIIVWFKRTFPSIFGKMNDDDVASTISDIYRRYKTAPEGLDAAAPKQGEESNVDSLRKLVTSNNPIAHYLVVSRLADRGLGLDVEGRPIPLTATNAEMAKDTGKNKTDVINGISDLSSRLPDTPADPAVTTRASVSTKAAKAGITDSSDLLLWTNNESMIDAPTLMAFKRGQQHVWELIGNRFGLSMEPMIHGVESLTQKAEPSLEQEVWDREAEEARMSKVDSELLKAQWLPVKAYPYSRLFQMAKDSERNPQHPLNQDRSLAYDIFQADNDARKQKELEDRFVVLGVNNLQTSVSSWEKYLLSNDAYPMSFRIELLRQVGGSVVRTSIQDGRIKVSKFKRTQTTEDALPSVDPEAVAQTFSWFSDGKKKDLALLYQKASEHVGEERTKRMLANSTLKQSDEGVWLKIASEDEDPGNFNYNEAALTSMSQGTPWCTGRGAARGYLSIGSFYVYRTLGSDGQHRSRIAIRMRGDEVAEVRGVADEHQNLEASMLPKLREFSADNNLPSLSEWVDRYQVEDSYRKLIANLEKDINYVPTESELAIIKKNPPYLGEIVTRIEIAPIFTSGYDSSDMLTSADRELLISSPAIRKHLLSYEASYDWRNPDFELAELGDGKFVNDLAMSHEFSGATDGSIVSGLVNNPLLTTEAIERLWPKWKGNVNFRRSVSEHRHTPEHILRQIAIDKIPDTALSNLAIPRDMIESIANSMADGLRSMTVHIVENYKTPWKLAQKLVRFNNGWRLRDTIPFRKDIPDSDIVAALDSLLTVKEIPSAEELYEKVKDNPIYKGKSWDDLPFDEKKIFVKSTDMFTNAMMDERGNAESIFAAPTLSGDLLQKVIDTKIFFSSLIANPNISNETKNGLMEVYGSDVYRGPAFAEDAAVLIEDVLNGGGKKSDVVSNYTENPKADPSLLLKLRDSGHITPLRCQDALDRVSFYSAAMKESPTKEAGTDKTSASVTANEAFKRFAARKGINIEKEFIDAAESTHRNFEPGWYRASGSTAESAEAFIQEECRSILQKVTTGAEADAKAPVFAPHQKEYAQKMTSIMEVPCINLAGLLETSQDTAQTKSPKIAVIGRGSEGAVFVHADFPSTAFKIWYLQGRKVETTPIPGMGWGLKYYFKNPKTPDGVIDVYWGEGASLDNTLKRISVSNKMGFVPIRVFGMSQNGELLTVQPLLRKADYVKVDDPEYFERMQMMVDDRKMVEVTERILGPKVGKKVALPADMTYMVEVDGKPYLVCDLAPGNVIRKANGEYTPSDAIITPIPPEYMTQNPDLQVMLDNVGDFNSSKMSASVTITRDEIRNAKRMIKNVGRTGGVQPGDIGLDKWIEVGRAMGRKDMASTMEYANEYLDSMVADVEDRDRFKSQIVRAGKTSTSWDVFAKKVMDILENGVDLQEKHHNNIVAAAYARRLASWGQKGGKGSIPIFTGDWGDNPTESSILRDGRSFYTAVVPKDPTGTKRDWAQLSSDEKSAWNEYVQRSKDLSAAVKEIADISVRDEFIPVVYRDEYETIVRDALNSEEVPSVTKSMAREQLLKLREIKTPDVAIEKMFNLIDKVKAKADALRHDSLVNLVKSTVAGESAYLKKLGKTPGRAKMDYAYNTKLQEYLNTFTTISASADTTIAKTSEFYARAKETIVTSSEEINTIEADPQGPIQDGFKYLSQEQMDKVDSLRVQIGRAQTEQMRIDTNPAVAKSLAEYLKRKELPRIEDMNDGQLKNIIENIMSIKKLGTLKKELADKQKEIFAADERTEAVREMSEAAGFDLTGNDNIALNAKLREENIARRKTLINRLKMVGATVKWGGWSLVTPENILGWMSGYAEDSALMRNIFKPINSAINDCFRISEVFVNDMMKTYEPCWSDLTGNLFADKYAIKTIENGKELSWGPFSMNQMMYVYANSKNVDNMSHLAATFGDSTSQVLMKVNDSLPASVKAAVDAQIAWYSDVQWAMINKEFQREHGVDMPKIDNYFPIRNLDYDTFSAKESIIEDMRNRMEIRRNPNPIVRKAFTKERELEAKQKFDSMDYFGTVSRNMLDVAWYVAGNEKITQAASFIKSPSIAHAMSQRSAEGYSQIERWVTEVAFGKERASTGADAIVDMMRRGVSVSALGARIVPILNQFPSWPVGLDGANPKAMLRAARDFLVEPGDILKVGRTLNMIYSLSPFMKNRPGQIQRELAEKIAATGEEGLLKRLGLPGNATSDAVRAKAIELGLPKEVVIRIPNFTFRSLIDLSMRPMNIVDQGIANHVWLSHFYTNEAKGVEAAVEAADTAVRKTQSLGDWRYAPEMFRKPGVGKLFTLFISPLNRQLNAFFERVYKAAEAKDSDAVSKMKDLGGALFFYVAAPAYVSYIAQHGSMSVDEPDDATNQVLQQMTGGIPIVNNLTTGVNAWVWSNIYSDPAKRASSTLVAKNSFMFSPAPLRMLSDTYTNPARGLSAMCGLPIGQILTYWKYREALFATGDWRASIWSPSQLSLNMKYPVSMAIGDPTTSLDGAIARYNEQNPTVSWHPAKCRETIQVKTKSDKKIIQLSNSEIEEMRREISLMFRTYVGDANAIATRVKQVQELIASGKTTEEAGNELITIYKSRIKNYDSEELTPNQVARFKKELSSIRKVALDNLKKRRMVIPNVDTGELFIHDGLENAPKEEYGIVDEDDEDDNPNLQTPPEKFNDIGGHMALISFADLPPDIKAKAEKLIDVSDAMSKLHNVRASLMDDLMPIAAKEPIEMDDGQIVYVDGSEGKTLSRAKVLALLMERLKISREAADQMVDEASDKKFISPYLKIMVKKMPKVPAPMESTENKEAK